MPEKYLVVGLMSGTSLDGLDIACVEFTSQDKKWTYNFNSVKSIPYDDHWQKRLAGALHLPESELLKLDIAYGHWLGEQVKAFLTDNHLKVELIASHGHTVYHEPHKGITRQIGDGQTIARETGILTIADFRSLDVHLGGQGAPLVPIGDQLLFSSYLGCLNLGGIANISYQEDGERIAFDISMANLPLNYFAREVGKPYDEDGNLAATGDTSHALLHELNNLAYYKKSAPKSLGIEWFFKELLPLVESSNLKVEDKLATLVEHEAIQIGRALSAINRPGKILLTGGGAYNSYLRHLIEQYIRTGQILTIPENKLVDYKEALIFALMGVLRLRNEINCLKSVTGATRDSSAGRLFYPQA